MSIPILLLIGATTTALPAMGDTPGGDRFGEDVAVSGDIAVVGRPSTRPGSSRRAGAVLVMVKRNGTWQLDSILDADPPVNGDGFGSAVAISGNTVAVSAPGPYVSLVHIFERRGNQWVRTAGIDAPTQHIGFGSGLDLRGDTLAVGARWHREGRGAVHVYSRKASAWTLSATITADDSEPEDYFGAALALGDERLLVGAWSRSPDTAYVFDRVDGVWQLSAQLQPAGGPAGGGFGFAVDIDSDAAVVTTLSRYVGGTQLPGAAYVFEHAAGRWSQSALLTAFDGSTNDLFGWSTALDGDTLLVGSIFDTDVDPMQGSAYSFSRLDSTWVAGNKLRAIASRPHDIFGSALALDGNDLWVGAPGFQNNGFGTAHVFERIGPAWNLGERFVDPIVFEDQFETD